MPTLTITVKEMFLYVTRKDAPDVVLFPGGGDTSAHLTRISVLDPKKKLKRAEISFVQRRDGQFKRIPGADRRDPPTEPHLVDLRKVLGNDAAVPKSLLEGEVPAALNARLVLPNGRTTAYPAMKSKARDIQWVFKRQGGGPVHTGKLTDIIQTVVPVSPGDLYVLIEYPDGSADRRFLTPVGSGDYFVEITNQDARCTGGKEIPEKEYTLDEYRLLYALTNTTAADPPLPVGTYGEPRDAVPLFNPISDCLPICGGANCPGEP